MDPVIYVDRAEIRPGRAGELEAAALQLVELVSGNARRAISYGIYFSPDRATMTVVHVHPDSDSLEQLMTLIAPVLAPFGDLLRLQSIDLFGSASETVVRQLRAKAKLLGGTVSIHDRVAGVAGPAPGTGG